MRRLILAPVVLAAACALPPNVEADVKPGTYKGKTIPGRQFALRVTKTERVLFLLVPRVRCTNGRRGHRDAGPNRPPKLDATGRFRYRETGSTTIGGRAVRYRFRIRGRVGAKVARGRFATIETRGSVTCRSRGRWVATRT